jgi:hypothetical protein
MFIPPLAFQGITKYMANGFTQFGVKHGLKPDLPAKIADFLLF